MSIKKDHELHTKRAKSNLILALILTAFVALVFAITISKMTAGHNLEAFDHVRRPALEPVE